MLFFGSYQGTNQTNGVSSLVTVSAPPLTDDRSAAAIGRLFAGQRGVQQNAMGGVGPAILADGSNINPIALALLQRRLPDGSYLLPTPQTINPAAAVCRAGLVDVLDAVHLRREPVHDQRGLRGIGVEPVLRTILRRGRRDRPGLPGRERSRVSAVDRRLVCCEPRSSHSWVLSSRLFNEARFGYGLLQTDRSQDGAFRFSEIGITSAPQNDDLPGITITGSYNLGSSAIGKRSQRTFLFEDSLSWVLNRHSIQVGGGFTKALRDFDEFRQPGGLTFQSFPDFLLGLNAAQNGTNLFSNVFVSVDLTGQFDRASRNWEASAYIQDSYRVSSRLTLNAGVRWEYLPPLTDATGRPTTVDASAPRSESARAGFPRGHHRPGAITRVRFQPASFRPTRTRCSTRRRRTPSGRAPASPGRCSATRAAS